MEYFGDASTWEQIILSAGFNYPIAMEATRIGS